MNLRRKPGQAIVAEHAGEQITFTINEVRGSQVFLSITAPQSFKILRSELVPVETEESEA